MTTGLGNIVIIEDYSSEKPLPEKPPTGEEEKEKEKKEEEEKEKEEEKKEEKPTPETKEQGEKQLTTTSRVKEIPGIGDATAKVLWANAFVSTVEDLAMLPERFPGIQSAITERGDLPMLDSFIGIAKKVMETKTT